MYDATTDIALSLFIVVVRLNRIQRQGIATLNIVSIRFMFCRKKKCSRVICFFMMISIAKGNCFYCSNISAVVACIMLGSIENTWHACLCPFAGIAEFLDAHKII